MFFEATFSDDYFLSPYKILNLIKSAFPSSSMAAARAAYGTSMVLIDVKRSTWVWYASQITIMKVMGGIWI